MKGHLAQTHLIPSHSGSPFHNKMFSADAKILLKNVIRHTKTHNRLLEEGDMWKQWEEQDKYKGRHSPVRGSLEDRGRHSSVRGSPEDRGRLSLVRGSLRCNGRPSLGQGSAGACLYQAHTDWDVGGSAENVREEENKSTYWRKQLLKAEETDPDRWGHSGFKELYKEFDSDTSHSEDHKQKHLLGAKKNCKKKHKRHKDKTYKQKDKSSYKGRRRHHSRSADEAVSEGKEEEMPYRKRARRHKKSSVEYVWVEKPMVTSSGDLVSKKNSVKCSSTRVDGGNSDDMIDSVDGGHSDDMIDSKDRPIDDATKHKKEHSLHKSRHRRNKSKHKHKAYTK